MDRTTALDIAREWAWGHSDADEHEQAEALAPRLAQTLTERLPDDAVATVLDYPDERVVVAVAGPMLIVVRAEAAKPGLWPRIHVAADGIDPQKASMVITDAFQGGYDGSGKNSAWRFDLDGHEIEIPLHGQRSSVSERGRQETFAIALARVIGLAIPPPVNHVAASAA
jgi:hypothetical protein